MLQTFAQADVCWTFLQHLHSPPAVYIATILSGHMLQYLGEVHTIGPLSTYFEQSQFASTPFSTRGLMISCLPSRPSTTSIQFNSQCNAWINRWYCLTSMSDGAIQQDRLIISKSHPLDKSTIVTFEFEFHSPKMCTYICLCEFDKTKWKTY